MPTFSAEYVSLPLKTWRIDPGFYVKLGNSDPELAKREKEQVLGVPKDFVIRGRYPHVLATPLHWQILVETLCEADEMVFGPARSVRLDLIDGKLKVRMDDSVAAQWAGLMYQAQGRRLIVGHNGCGKGDSVRLNGHERNDPIAMPFGDMPVEFESVMPTFAGVTRFLSRAIGAADTPSRHGS